TDVTITPVPFPAMQEALEAGKVDLGMFPQPFAALAEKQAKVRKIFDAKYGIPRSTSDTTVRYSGSLGSRYASKFPIEVIRRDDDLDLAIFRLPPVQNWHLIGLGKSNDVPEDTRLYVLGPSSTIRFTK